MSLILDLLFPRQCYLCRKSGDYLCPSCRDSLVYLSLKENRLSLFKYRSPLKNMLQDLKYQYQTDLANYLAQICTKNIQENFPHLLRFWQENHFTLIPIPLHWYRQNYRGFNQSELLGHALAKSLNLSFSSNLLIRTRYTSPQVKTKDKKVRQSNINHAFSFNSNHYPLKTNRYILFDDVYTTGSTLKSASSVFPKNTEIFYLTLAG